MAGRRKGEKPIVYDDLRWSPNCVITHAIDTGSGWLDAWIGQQCMPLERLAKRSGLTLQRLDDLLRGARPTPVELAALAPHLRTDALSLAASIDLAASRHSAPTP